MNLRLAVPLVLYVSLYFGISERCNAARLAETSRSRSLHVHAVVRPANKISSNDIVRSETKPLRAAVKAIIPAAVQRRQNRLALVTKPGAVAAAATTHVTYIAPPYNGGPTQATKPTTRATSSTTTAAPRVCPDHIYGSYGDVCAEDGCCRWYTPCRADASGNKVCGKDNGCTGVYHDKCDASILTNGGSKCCGYGWSCGYGICS